MRIGLVITLSVLVLCCQASKKDIDGVYENRVNGVEDANRNLLFLDYCYTYDLSVLIC